MKSTNEIYEEIRNKFPENVLGIIHSEVMSVSSALSNAGNHNEKYVADNFQEIIQSYNYLDAFFKYVSPLIENIAYCKIEDAKLIGKNFYGELELSFEEIEKIERRVGEMSSMLKIHVAKIEELKNQIRHPYQ